MGLAILRSRAQAGVDAPAVTVEVFLSGGLPAFTIVGMAERGLELYLDQARARLASGDLHSDEVYRTIADRLLRGGE